MWKIFSYSVKLSLTVIAESVQYVLFHSTFSDAADLLQPVTATLSSIYQNPAYPEVNIERASDGFWMCHSSEGLPSREVHWWRHRDGRGRGRGSYKWRQHVPHTRTWRTFTLACHWLRRSRYSQKSGDLQSRRLLRIPNEQRWRASCKRGPHFCQPDVLWRFSPRPLCWTWHWWATYYHHRLTTRYSSSIFHQNLANQFPKYAKYGLIWPNMVFGAHVLASQIWSSGVSLKRSCEMQFRGVNLAPIGPSVKSFDQKSFLSDFLIEITM